MGAGVERSDWLFHRRAGVGIDWPAEVDRFLRAVCVLNITTLEVDLGSVLYSQWIFNGSLGRVLVCYHGYYTTVATCCLLTVGITVS